jgi:hypothetical protein
MGRENGLVLSDPKSGHISFKFYSMISKTPITLQKTVTPAAAVSFFDA